MKDLDKFKNEMNLSGKNVYVGHRYVPKIFGEWDNTRIYEPLSIVQYQGASYTSRQYVPIGVELTNEDFWVVTGNYNAQVEQYRQDVKNNTDEVLKYKADTTEQITKLKTDTTEQITQLKTDTTEQITQLKTDTAEQFEQLNINVTDHGLVGDGVTDNSLVFENLIKDYHNAVFYFPDGVYLFKTPINPLKNVYYDYQGEITTNGAYSVNRGVIETLNIVGNSKENTILTSNGNAIFAPSTLEERKPFNITAENIRFVGKDKTGTPFNIINGEVNAIYTRFINCDFNNWEYGFKYDFRTPVSTGFNTMALFDRCNFGGNKYGAMVTGDNSTLKECWIRNNDIGGLIVGGADINIIGGKIEYNGRGAGIVKPFQIKLLTGSNTVNFIGSYLEPKTSNNFEDNNQDTIIVTERNAEKYEYISNVNFIGCRINGLRVGSIMDILGEVYIRGLHFSDTQIFGLKLKSTENELITSDGVSTLVNVGISGGTIYDIRSSANTTLGERDYILTTQLNTVNSFFNTHKSPIVSSEIRKNGASMEQITGSIGSNAQKYYGGTSYSIVKESTGIYVVTLYKENKGLTTGDKTYFPVTVTPRHTTDTRRIASVEVIDSQSFKVHIQSDTGNYFDNGFTFTALIITD